jgi:Ca2+-binding RTX toxin-like protein
MHAAKVALLIGTFATGWLAVPASVSRASVDVAVETTDPTGAEKLVLRPLGTDTNIVFVRYEEPAYVVTSAISPITAGSGCWLTDLNVATCVGAIGSATIRGGDGADVIDFTGVPVRVNGDGGAGDDALTGGVARNMLKGGKGVDQLTGGPQRDDLTGRSGDDWILGRGGSDSLFGEAGNDIVQAGTGDREVLVGGSGQDLLEGGSGYDLLQGDAGADALFGGAGADTIAPGTGADAVIGLHAPDRLDCPTEVIDGETSVTPCAQIEKGRPPESWPPPQSASTPAEASRRQRHRRYAAPVVPGHATGVQVHVPADRWKWVRRCLRTYSDRHRQVALDPYRVKFKSKFWPTIEVPAPNPVARTARLTPPKPCRR